MSTVICERCEIIFDSKLDPDCMLDAKFPRQWGWQVPTVLCMRCREKEIEQGDLELATCVYGE